MDDPSSALASALADAARSIEGHSSVDETLDAIVRAAKLSVPEIDDVGVSIVHRDGRIETRAATGQLVWDLDGIQYELGEGPCVSAMRDYPVVLADELRHDQRWPRYVPRAVATGLQAQMAVRLYVDDQTLGGLNMYSTRSPTIHVGALEAAELFAAHAAIALGHARREQELHAAIDTRKVIGQAIGLVMERYSVDEHRAFQYLVRASTTGNIKLRDVAQEVVDRANRASHGRDEKSQ